MVSFDIAPPEVTAGETVSVTAGVKNIGGSEDVYTAILSVDGAEVEREDVTVTPEVIEKIAFSLVRDEAGTYQVAIGGRSASLIVKPKLIEKEIELNYDDGEAKDFASASEQGGYIIDFTPPSVPFTVKKVQIYGALFGTGWEGKNFEVEIWDKAYRVLYRTTYPVTKFAVRNPGWVEVEIPNIQVSDKFYVPVYTGTGRMQGIHIGADDSVVNLHSGITIRTGKGITTIGFSGWPYPKDQWVGDRSKVNWMIRVVGTYFESGQTPPPPPLPTSHIVQISTAHGIERELKTKAALEELLAQYDVSKWIFTKSILIEEGAIPYCCPLTLSTAFLSYDYINLSTFIHEQLEMFVSTKDPQMNQAMIELRALYPKVPTDSTGTQSDRTEAGTYKHLVLCYLEFSAMKKLAGEEAARSTMERMGHYIWVYETVLADSDKIDSIVRKYNLIIE